MSAKALTECPSTAGSQTEGLNHRSDGRSEPVKHWSWEKVRTVFGLWFARLQEKWTVGESGCHRQALRVYTAAAL